MEHRDIQLLKKIISECKDIIRKASVIIVGDSLSADIKGGIDFGISTCWYNPQGLEHGDLKADYEIRDLRELVGLLL